MLFFIFVYMFIIGINIIMVVVVMTLRRRQRQRLLNEQMAERWCRSLFPKQSSLWWSWAVERLDAIWTKPSKRIWTNEWALPPHFPYVLPSSIHPSNRPSVRPFKCLSIESLRWCAECWRVDFVRYGNRVLSLAMGTLHCVVFEALRSECNGGKKTQSANIVHSWNWPNNCRRVMTVATDNRVSHMNK